MFQNTYLTLKTFDIGKIKVSVSLKFLKIVELDSLRLVRQNYYHNEVEHRQRGPTCCP